MFWKNTMKKCQLANNMLVGANWWRDISPIMLQWHISLHQCPLTSWFLPRGLLFVLFTSFWKCVESYYFVRSKQLVHVNLKEILIDILTSECPLRNYLTRMGKICLWSCRRNEVLPNIDSFIIRVNIEHETEKYTSALRIRVYKN